MPFQHFMSKQSNGITALLPERFWDGESEGTFSNYAVILEGEKIITVRPAETLSDEIRTVKLPGCTLLPGLIDAHVHYTTGAGPLFLAAGVTAVRDTGNDLDWILGERERTRGNPAEGPAIICCGPALDGVDGIWKWIIKRHADEESLKDSIGENVERGVDAIKLYAGLDPRMLRAGVEEAHRLGMFVLSHLNETSAEAAAAAGLNEIEHFSRCDTAWRDAAPEEDDRLIDRFLEMNVIMTPTLIIWDRLGRAMEHSFLQDRRLQWMHPDYLEIWERNPYRRCEPERRLRYQTAIPNLKRFLLRCHEKGVTLAAGTDAPFQFMVPGFCLHDELATYVDAGLPPVVALRSATSVNARVLGLEEETGRILPGLKADLLAVKGNPLRRIDDLANVTAVFRNGIQLDPGDLLEEAVQGFSTPMDDPLTRDLQAYVSGDMPNYAQKS